MGTWQFITTQDVNQDSMGAYDNYRTGCKPDSMSVCLKLLLTCLSHILLAMHIQYSSLWQKLQPSTRYFSTTSIWFQYFYDKMSIIKNIANHNVAQIQCYLTQIPLSSALLCLNKQGIVKLCHFKCPLNKCTLALRNCMTNGCHAPYLDAPCPEFPYSILKNRNRQLCIHLRKITDKSVKLEAILWVRAQWYKGQDFSMESNLSIQFKLKRGTSLFK